MWPRSIIVVLAGMCLLPAAAWAQAPECEGARPDSLASAVPPIYRDCDVTRKAEPRGNAPRLEFNPAQSGSTLPRCLLAEFSMVIDSTGRVEPGTLQVVSTNHPAYAAAVGKSFAGQRFRPAELEGRPVRQLAVIGRTMATMVRFTVSPSGGARRPMPIADREPPTGGC